MRVVKIGHLLDFQNGWGQKVGQLHHTEESLAESRNNIFASQIWKNKYEFQEFGTDWGWHGITTFIRVLRQFWLKCYLEVCDCLECERVMAWYQSKRDLEKQRRCRVLSGYHQLWGHMRDRGKSWSQSSSHTVLKDAADYAWRLETRLSYTFIPPHKSVLRHPLFTDKAVEHSLVQSRKPVTSSSLRNHLSHTLSSFFMPKNNVRWHRTSFACALKVADSGNWTSKFLQTEKKRKVANAGFLISEQLLRAKVIGIIPTRRKNNAMKLRRKICSN